MPRISSTACARRGRTTASPRSCSTRSACRSGPEISAADFAKALGTEIFSSLPFDAQLFGTAANNGQMIAEVQPAGKITEAFGELAAAMTGRSEPKRTKANLLEPILARLARRKAS